MKEIAEFRIPEKYAKRFLEPHEGKCLGGTVRLFRIAVDDPRYQYVGEVDRQLQQQEGHGFFLGWHIKRHYSRPELDSAEVFHLLITAVFEPAGEQCGTVYDDSTACSICRAGRTQRSDLVLDLRKAPKNKGFARTIADEWVVSQRLAEILTDACMTGFELRPVRHKALYRDDPIDPTKVPAGRELLRRAEEAGVPYPTYDFYVWVNRPEQRELAEREREEHAALLGQRDQRRARPLPVWYQLVVTSAPVEAVAPTRFDPRPFDEDREGLYRCPLGHVSGLNLLSEIWVSRTTWDGSDIARTRNLVGIRRGVLVPSALLLISPRLWHLLKEENIRGYEAEVAHLV